MKNWKQVAIGALSVWLGWTAFSGPTSVQAQATLTTEEVRIDHQDEQIYGYVTVREDLKDQALPLIIYAHGFGGRAERGDRYATGLAQAGYRVYSLDFGGGNLQSRTHGDILAMSVFTEADELGAVVDFWQADERTKDQPLYLLGESQGGVVATLTAADHPDQVAGLILIYPAYVLFDDARDIFSSVDEIPDVYNHRGNNVGKVYFERSLDYDVFKTMDQVRQPVYIVHGTEDDIAPIRYSRQALEHFEKAELKEIPGAGHFFSSQVIDQVLPDIVNFISQTSANKP